MFERISLNQPPVLSLQNANAHDSVLRLDPLQKHPNADGTDYKKTTASARNIHIWSMKLLRNFFLGFVVFTFPFTIGVADDIVDLKAAYDLARQNDPRFRIAYENYYANKAKQWQARASLGPSLSAMGSKNSNNQEYETDFFSFSQPTGSARFESGEYTFSLRLPILNLGLYASLDQASADVRRTNAEYIYASQDTIMRVIEAYMGIIQAEENLSLTNAESRSLRQTLEDAEGRIEAGFATISDVQDARSRYQQALAVDAEAANRLDDKIEALREITGRRLEKIKALGEHLPLELPDPNNIDHWVKAALTNNQSLRAQMEAVNVAKIEITRSRTGHAPTLDFTGSLARVDADKSIAGPGTRTDNKVLSLQLNVPIFQSGLVLARTSEAVHKSNSVTEEYEAKRRATERFTRSAFLGTTGGITKVNAGKQAVDAARLALEAKTEGYQSGVYTLLDVLNASRELFRARLFYTEARHNYIVSAFRLKLSVATLSEYDVTQLNHRLTSRSTTIHP